MNVLVACEFSGRVREAFRKAGHDAWSCDLLPALDNEPWHIQDDVLHVLKYGKCPLGFSFDLMIAFPPCTHLAVSGARYFKEKQKDGRQQAAIDFVEALWRADIPRICIENPVGVLSTKSKLGKPTQIIQPWQFGHDEAKKTCLWLKRLPLLRPTNVLSVAHKSVCYDQHGNKRRVWSNQTPSGQNRLGPSHDRAMLRSLTYQGVADAMAKQWSLKPLEF